MQQAYLGPIEALYDLADHIVVAKSGFEQAWRHDCETGDGCVVCCVGSSVRKVSGVLDDEVGSGI